jgi:hypothetical protein
LSLAARLNGEPPHGALLSLVSGGVLIQELKTLHVLVALSFSELNDS